MADDKNKPIQPQRPGMLNQGNPPPSQRSDKDEEQGDWKSMMEQMVKQQALLIETLSTQLRAVSNQTHTNTSNVNVLDRRADLMEERITDRDIFAVWGGLRTVLKTQLEADRLFPPRMLDGKVQDKRYRVGLLGEVTGGDQSTLPLPGQPTNKITREPKRNPIDVPEVDLWANSPEEVKGRYMQLCSINGIKWTVAWNIREIPAGDGPGLPLMATDTERTQINRLQEMLAERAQRTGKPRPPWDLTPNRQYAALLATTQG